MKKIFIKTLKTAFFLYLLLSLSSCVIPYLKTTPIEKIDSLILSNYDFFYKGTLENPKMILADKQGSLKNTSKSWEKANHEEVIHLLSQAKKYDTRELIVKNNKIISSEGFLLTLKSFEDEFYYNFSTNIKKGYFIITKINKRDFGELTDVWEWSRFKR